MLKISRTWLKNWTDSIHLQCRNQFRALLERFVRSMRTRRGEGEYTRHWCFLKVRIQYWSTWAEETQVTDWLLDSRPWKSAEKYERAETSVDHTMNKCTGIITADHATRFFRRFAYVTPSLRAGKWLLASPSLEEVEPRLGRCVISLGWSFAVSL